MRSRAQCGTCVAELARRLQGLPKKCFAGQHHIRTAIPGHVRNRDVKSAPVVCDIAQETPVQNSRIVRSKVPMDGDLRSCARTQCAHNIIELVAVEIPGGNPNASADVARERIKRSYELVLKPGRHRPCKRKKKGATHLLKFPLLFACAAPRHVSVRRLVRKVNCQAWTSVRVHV